MGNFKSVQIENVGIFDLIFPVGSIYQTMSSDFNPSFIWGGTWIRIAKGKTLIGVDENDTNFVDGKSGGASSINLSHTHTVNSHAHTITHTHTVNSHTHTMGHTHTVNAHNHTTAAHTLTVNEMPKHRHSGQIRRTDMEADGYGLGAATGFANRVMINTSSWDFVTSYEGGGASHSHGNTGNASPATGNSSITSTGGSSPTTGNPSTTNSGNASPGTNSQLSSSQSILPPYITCYIWQRTA